MNAQELQLIAQEEGYYLSGPDAEFLADEIQAEPGRDARSIANELAAGGYIDFEPLAAAEPEYAPVEYAEPEDDFEDLAERVEQDQGRALTQAELDKLWELDQRAEREGQDEVSGEAVKAALFDKGTAAGRKALIDARMQDLNEPEQAEPLEAPGPDATAEQRIQYINQRTSATNEGDPQ
jgi:hypothetical protein